VAKNSLGADGRLTLVTLGSLEYVRDQASETFDLVFADAMPGKYEGLGEALSVVKTGGFYVIDDMLPQQNWPDGHAAKVPLLIETLASKPDFGDSSSCLGQRSSRCRAEAL
jgi:predicted O-methyltransferase YrrM